MDKNSLLKKYLNDFSDNRQNPRLPLYIALLYLELANYDSSESWLVKSFEIDKTFSDAHFFASMLALIQNKYDIAILEAESFLKYSKNPFEFYKSFELPFEMDIKKIQDKAVAAAEHRFKILPDNFETSYLLGLVHALWGEYKEAIKALESVLNSKPTSFKYLMVLSELYLMDNNIADAIEVLKRLYWQDNDSLPVMKKLSELYMQTKDFTRSFFFLRKVFEMKPLSPDVLLGLGVVYKELGKNEMAIEMFTDCLVVEPNFVKAYFEFGILCEETFRFQSALDFFRKVLELKYDFGEAYYHIALVYKRMGNNSEAIPYFYRALKYVENNAYIHYDLAESLMSLKEYEEAAIEFMEVIKKDSKDAYAYMNAGRCMTFLKNYTEAEYFYKKAMEVKDDFFEPLYYLALNFSIEDNFKQAIEALNMFVEKKGQDTYAKFALGNIYLRQGQYEEAVNEYMQAINLYPSHPYARYSLAASYACAGKYEKAQQEFAEALKSDPPTSEDEMILFAVFGSYQSILQRLTETILELKVYFRHYKNVEFRLRIEEKVKNKIADLFKKILPEKIAEDVISSEDFSENKQDEIRNVTVLFTDIRGYVEITRILGAVKAFNFLNDYYKLISSIVTENKGVLLFFQGDAQMVVFEDADDGVSHELNAFNTAVSIKKEVSKLVIDEIGRINIALSLASGDVTLGFLNDNTRFQYTAIGDAVNISSRLQAISKERNSAIVMSGKVYEKLKCCANIQEIKFVESFNLRGITDAIDVYEVRN